MLPYPAKRPSLRRGPFPVQVALVAYRAAAPFLPARPPRPASHRAPRAPPRAGGHGSLHSASRQAARALPSAPRLARDPLARSSSHAPGSCRTDSVPRRRDSSTFSLCTAGPVPLVDASPTPSRTAPVLHPPPRRHTSRARGAHSRRARQRVPTWYQYAIDHALRMAYNGGEVHCPPSSGSCGHGGVTQEGPSR